MSGAVASRWKTSGSRPTMLGSVSRPTVTTNPSSSTSSPHLGAPSSARSAARCFNLCRTTSYTTSSPATNVMSKAIRPCWRSTGTWTGSSWTGLRFGRWSGRPSGPSTSTPAVSSRIQSRSLTSLEEATLCFEDVVMPLQEYEEAVTLGLAAPLDPTELKPPIYPTHLAQRLERVGMTTPDAANSGTTRDIPGRQQFVQLSEMYFRGTDNRWIMGWLVWNITRPEFKRLQMSRYPRPPYRMAVAR